MRVATQHFLTMSCTQPMLTEALESPWERKAHLEPRYVLRLMRMSALVVFFQAGTSDGQYDPPPGYYSTATGTGSALKSQLAAVINPHTQIGYSNRVAPLDRLDQDPNNANNLLLVYTGASVAKSQFPTGSANTEHLWCNTYGIDSTEPRYSDLFNLRPCDQKANSDRADKFYDNGGSPDANAPLCKTDADSWEARDVEKGDLARAMFYMATCYAGNNFALTDNTSLITTSGAYMGKLSTLLAWHYQDPVSTEERARNHLIYTDYQHNRNPYVDHPEYVWTIFGSALNNSRVYLGAAPPADGASSLNLAYRVIKGAAPPSQAVVLNKTGTTPTTCNVTASGAVTCSPAGSGLSFLGGPRTAALQIAFTSAATAGLSTASVTIDNTDLTSADVGLGSADGNDVIAMSETVLEHSIASFTSITDANSLTIDFGLVPAGSGLRTRTFTIYNLETAPGFTAGLDLDAVIGGGQTATLTTDLAPFIALPANSARTFTATFDTSAIGFCQATYTLAVSDEDVPGAAAGPTLTLILQGTTTGLVLVPADFDRDGDVDAADFEHFRSCANGAGRPPAGTGCTDADLDGDGDVDQEDFGTLQRCYSGTNLSPDPACAG